MATFLLLPNATGVSSAHWVVSADTRHECLDDDNGNTSYVSCDNHGVSMILEYADPSVDEGDIDSIDSVRFISSGRSTAGRGVPSLVNIGFRAPTAGFTESCSFDSHFSLYETINGTARTTSDGSNAWTYANLEALEMICTKTFTANVRLSYLALEVTYTELVTAADNSTFFGANF